MKKLILIILLTFAAGAVFAESSVWKISRDNNVLYLGGTVHILRAEDYPLPQEFDFAYNESDTVIFETDIGKMDDPDVAQKILTDGMYRDGRSLKTVLKPSVYHQLKEVLEEFLVPIDSVKYFKPGMIASTLTALSFQTTDAFSEGVDAYFYSKAIDDQKNINFLETVDQQIDLVVNMGIGNENEFILYSIQDLEGSGENLALLIDEWRTGSHEVMEETIAELKEEFERTYQSLVSDRNELWMKKILKYLQNDEIEFLLFGTLHLHGQDGILGRLIDAGFIVEQVILAQ